MYGPLSFELTVRIRATLLIAHKQITDTKPRTIPDAYFIYEYSLLGALGFNDLGLPSRWFRQILWPRESGIFPRTNTGPCHLERRLSYISDIQGAPVRDAIG
jgi:hypothetical protein